MTQEDDVQDIFTKMFYGEDQSYDKIILKIEDLESISILDQSHLYKSSNSIRNTNSDHHTNTQDDSKVTINDERDPQ